jgi:hypothetical protein
VSAERALWLLWVIQTSYWPSRAFSGQFRGISRVLSHTHRCSQPDFWPRPLARSPSGRAVVGALAKGAVLLSWVILTRPRRVGDWLAVNRAVFIRAVASVPAVAKKRNEPTAVIASHCLAMPQSTTTAHRSANKRLDDLVTSLVEARASESAEAIGTSFRGPERLSSQFGVSWRVLTGTRLAERPGTGGIESQTWRVDNANFEPSSEPVDRRL